jgi:hypothetical protein
MAAFRDGWKKPVSTVTPKPEKQKRTAALLPEIEPRPSDDQKGLVAAGLAAWRIEQRVISRW